MVKFTSEASADSLPDTVIVAAMEKIIEKGDAGGEKNDRKFALSFAKLAAILQDFSLFCAEKNDASTRFLVVAKLSLGQERFLSPKLSLWFPEIWEVYQDSIVCRTSSREPVTLKYFLSNNQYFLDSFSVN